MAAKITRATQKVFGSTATTNQLAKFGSLAAGSPVRYDGTTVTPANVQALSNFLDGWFQAVMGGNSPAIEDMNSLFWLVTRQLAYLMQQGVAEYDAATEYFIGSVCMSAGKLYVSITDNNIGNALTNATNWKSFSNGVTNVTGTYTATSADEYLRCDPSGGSFVVTLPALSTMAMGQRLTIKNVSSGGNTVTVQRAGSDNIDGATSVVLDGASGALQSITIMKGTSGSWDII